MPNALATATTSRLDRGLSEAEIRAEEEAETDFLALLELGGHISSRKVRTP